MPWWGFRSVLQIKRTGKARARHLLHRFSAAFGVVGALRPNPLGGVGGSTPPHPPHRPPRGFPLAQRGINHETIQSMPRGVTPVLLFKLVGGGRVSLVFRFFAKRQTGAVFPGFPRSRKIV